MLNKLILKVRLFQSEYKGLLSTTSEEGLEPDLISFRKKGGWVKVGIEKLEGEFEFHRKKISTIQEGRFQDHYQYRIKEKGQIKTLENWEGVLAGLRRWISEKGEL